MSQNDAIVRSILTSPYGFGGSLTIGTGGVTENGQATLTNKTLVDNSVFWQDDTDPTKKVAFELSGLTTGKTRTLTVPDSNGTIALSGDLSAYVTIAGNETITGTKTIDDNKFILVSNSDPDNTVTFDCANATNGGLNTYVLPTNSGTSVDIVGRTTAETLTNKTIDNPTIINNMKLNNPADTYTYNINAGNITANRNINLGLLAQDDTLLYVNQIQSGIGTKTFLNNALRIQDSTALRYLQFQTSAQTVNANVRIPVLPASDTFVMENTEQILSNKVVSDDLLIGATDAPQVSSILELRSTSKAFLPPRLTTLQKLNIASPVAGMVIFDTDLQSLQIFDGLNWEYATRARYASMYVSTPISTSLLANTWTKISGTTTEANASIDMSMTADNQITYSGVSTRVFKIEATLSVEVSNKNLSYAIFVNGVVNTSSVSSAYSMNNKDNIVSVMCIASLSTGSYVEIFTRNDDDATNPTIRNMTLTVTNCD